MGTRSPDDSIDTALIDEIRAERFDAMSGPESPEGRALGAAVGANVARLRKRHGLERSEIAERSGIREALVAALEAGEAVPSLRAIWHLATALRVPFGSLLANTRLGGGEPEGFRIQAAAEGRVIASASNRFRSRVLFDEGDSRTPEVYELTLSPGCVEEAAAHAPGTSEHIVVVRGALVVRSPDGEAQLGPGDALFFRADVPHRYENRGPHDVVAHLVMTYGDPRP
jgi:transcriptional regulator with XRE-family HTH domain